MPYKTDQFRQAELLLVGQMSGAGKQKYWGGGRCTDVHLGIMPSGTRRNRGGISHKRILRYGLCVRNAVHQSHCVALRQAHECERRRLLHFRYASRRYRRTGRVIPHRHCCRHTITSATTITTHLNFRCCTVASVRPTLCVACNVMHNVPASQRGCTPTFAAPVLWRSPASRKLSALPLLQAGIHPFSATGGHARRARIVSCADSADESGKEEGDSAAEEEMHNGEESIHVFRRNGSRRRYNGDLLPFDLRVISPPPRHLGRFPLDPRTHCGDIIEYNDHQFVVKRVVLHYKYGANGKAVVFRKTIEIKSLARKAIECYLENSLRK